MSEDRGPEEPVGSDSGDSPEEEHTGSDMQSGEAPEEQMSSDLERGDTAREPFDTESEAGEGPEDRTGSEPELGDPLIGSELAAEEPETPTDSGPSEPGGCGYFLKRGLRWAVVVLVIFTIGIVAMQIVRVQPLIDERNSLNQSLTETEAAQQDLQVELNRLKGVEQDNQALSESLQEAGTRLALLNILVDVTRAQLALAQEDTVRVAAALQGTGEKLSSLGDLVDTSELIGLRERLVLVLSEVDEDPFAAERDLEILANTLLEIEQKLAGE